jgi:RNA polymerase sigma-70 factor (ECF subfamily)
MPTFLSSDEARIAGRVAILEEPRADPEKMAGIVDELRHVDVALMGLSEEYRIVLNLRDGEDLSYQEISEILDIPLGTVRSRISRARTKLRKAVRHA